MCKVTEIIDGKKLAYSWSYKGLPGNSILTFELFPEGNKTKLKLMHAGLETLEPAGPDLQERILKKVGLLSWTNR